MKNKLLIPVLLLIILAFSCEKNKPNENTGREYYTPARFVMGADLSYINEILDHGGVYRDSGVIEDPYRIFKQYGLNVARFRLFHNPVWTSEKYGGGQMYQDFNDVKLGIERAKDNGLLTCLDFHYSDTWADPGHQEIPAAWEGLSVNDLRDSLYNYTLNTLLRLDDAELMPEYVQVGNEINPGFLLPVGSRWNARADFIYLLNGAIQAVKDAGTAGSFTPQIVIHIAQPENVIGWFDGLKAAGLADFDIMGFSYYYSWSSVALTAVSNNVSAIRTVTGKEVMVMETTYPWTYDNADNYGNHLDIDKLVLPGYPASETGQYKYLRTLTQEIIDGGGKGIFTWEPAWITSDLLTQWGTGSSWDCNTLFDFEGNVIKGMDFMTWKYDF